MRSSCGRRRGNVASARAFRRRIPDRKLADAAGGSDNVRAVSARPRGLRRCCRTPARIVARQGRLGVDVERHEIANGVGASVRFRRCATVLPGLGEPPPHDRALFPDMSRIVGNRGIRPGPSHWGIAPVRSFRRPSPDRRAWPNIRRIQILERSAVFSLLLWHDAHC